MLQTTLSLFAALICFQAPSVNSTPYTFRYLSPTPGHHVNIAGDFNNWNKSANEMKALAGGRDFRLTIPLTYGRHTYKFVIDGDNWILDPNNPNSISDGNGNTNSAVVVLPPDYDQPAQLGDGHITASALAHTQSIPDLNYDEGQLQFGLRTRPNDIQSITLQVKGQKDVSLHLVGADDIFAHYEGHMDWNRKADLEYVFKLTDGSKTAYFGPKGLSDSPDGNFYKLDAKTYQPFVVPNWVQRSVVYQIFPERFANGDPSNDGPNVQPWGGTPTFSNRFGGDLAGVTQHLDYLKSLGIGCIYFNPLFESPANHGYETDDYHKIDHRFGTNDEFDQMVKALRKSGIHTILDGVFNHTSRGFFAFHDVVVNGEKSPYTQWYFFHGFPVHTEDPINYVGWYGYASLPKLNTANPPTRQYLLGIPKFWADQSPISGWRLDAAEEVSDDYWRDFRKTVKAIDPENWICGEIWGDASHWLQGDMFDSVMNYRFRGSMLGYLGVGGDAKPSTLWSSLMATYALYAPQVSRTMMNVVDSHDTERLLTEVGHDRALANLAAILQFTWVGTPSIYYGDELGLDGGKDPDDRRCMPWEQANDQNPTLKLYKKLVAMRNISPELQMGRPIKLVADDSTGIIAFGRLYHGREAIIILNRSNQEQRVNITEDISGSQWRDIFSGTPLDLAHIVIEPKSALVYLPAEELTQ